MATTYHDWASGSYDDATKLSRLRSYMGEIQAQMGAPDVSADGKSVDRNALNQLLKTLVDAETKLMARLPKAYVTKRR